MKLGEKFAALMNSSGVKVHKAVLLGKWLHVDTNQSDEIQVRTALSRMGATEIKTLPKAPDGVHLDGSRHHRIVATF